MHYQKINDKEKRLNKKDLLKLKKKKKEEIVNTKKEKKIFEKI